MAYRRTPAVQARLDEQRRAVVAAAIAQLSEHGYAGCSVAAVAARAGVASGTVYKDVESKADLVAEVFRTAARREGDAVARAAARERTAAEAIAAVIETFAGRALRAPRMAYALLAEPVDPAVEAERLVFRRAYAEAFAGVVRRGVDAGELPAQDVGISAAALVGALGEALVGPLAAGAAGTPARDATQDLITFAQRSIGAVT